MRIPWPWRRKDEQYRPAHAAGTAAPGAQAPPLPYLGERADGLNKPHKFAADPSANGDWCACSRHWTDPIHGERGTAG